MIGGDRRPAAGLALAALIVVVLTGSASSATDSGRPAATDPLAGLTTRQLAGQMIVSGFAGRSAPASLVRRIRAGEVAGVILFSRNIGSRRALRAEIRRLQKIPRPRLLQLPLLVMVDQEGGQVKRLSGAPTRSPAEIGRTGSNAIARAEGRATARNLAGVGINVNLAPVMDVGRPGSYQQRTGRSYSSDPKVVAELGGEFVAGLGDGDVASTLKHFPGLGTVPADQDRGIQRVGLSATTLRNVDELPFREGIDSGAELVMMSTAVYQALDRSAPAVFSYAITTRELRTRVGFQGVTITDDLEVPAMRRYGSVQRRALRAARAGNNLLLFGQDVRSGARAHGAIVAAMRSGALSKRLVRTSAFVTLLLRAGFVNAG